MNSGAVIIIPVYKPVTDRDEQLSLQRTVEIALAGGHDLCIVRPRGLDLAALSDQWPQLQFEDFDPSFFDGIRGYNGLLTSAEFYSRFETRWEYMLIAQLDSYIFRDDIAKWCERGFDYVGAPWLCRPVNRLWIIDIMNRIKDRSRHKKGMYKKRELYGRIGNGGFSLRRIRSHREVCEKNKEELIRLNEVGRKGYPEDVFWAMRDGVFKYPTAREALGFAFDKYPAFCYKLAGRRLPMGCHGWTSRKMRSFWKKFIPSSSRISD